MKQIKNKTLRFIVALALMLSLSVTSFATVFAATSDMAGENESNFTLSTDAMNITYQEGETYYLTVSLDARIPVASYNVQLYLPDYLTIVGVSDCGPLGSEKDTFLSEIVNGGEYVSVNSTSGYDRFNGTHNIFQVEFSVKYVPDYTECPFINRFEVTTQDNVRYDVVTESFGSITVVNEELPPESPTRSMGDMDNDGDIDLNDLITIQRYLLNPNVNYLDDEQYTYADINHDGDVNLLDCQYIQGYLVGRLETLEDIYEGQGGGGEENPPAYENVRLTLTFSYEQDGKIITLDRFTEEIVGGTMLYGYVRNYVMNNYSGEYEYEGIYTDGSYSTLIGDVENMLVNDVGNVIYVKLYRVDVPEMPSDSYIILFSATAYDNSGNVMGSANFEGFLPVGESINMLLDQYREYNGWKLMGAYTDSSYNTPVNENTEITDEMTIYLKYWAESSSGGGSADEQTTQVSVTIITFVDGERMDVAGTGMSLALNKDVNTAVRERVSSMMGATCVLSAVYYDSALTTPVPEEDMVTSEIKELYVVVENVDISGTYELTMSNYDDTDGSYSSTVVGTMTLTASGSATINVTNGTAIRGTYKAVVGSVMVNYGDRCQYIVVINSMPTTVDGKVVNGSAMVIEEFSSAGATVTQEFEEVAGEYTVHDPEEQKTYGLTLYNDGIFELYYSGITRYGFYTYSGTVFTLDPDGDAMYAVLIDAENKIMEAKEAVYQATYNIIEETKTDTGEAMQTTIGTLTMNADGSVTMTVNGKTENGTYFAPGEGAAYVNIGGTKQYFLMVNTDTVKIMETIDISGLTMNPELAMLSGTYTLNMYGMEFHITLSDSGYYEMQMGANKALGLYTYDPSTNSVVLESYTGNITVTVDRTNWTLTSSGSMGGGVNGGGSIEVVTERIYNADKSMYLELKGDYAIIFDVGNKATICEGSFTYLNGAVEGATLVIDYYEGCSIYVNMIENEEGATFEIVEITADGDAMQPIDNGLYEVKSGNDIYQVTLNELGVATMEYNGLVINADFVIEETQSVTTDGNLSYIYTVRFGYPMANIFGADSFILDQTIVPVVKEDMDASAGTGAETEEDKAASEAENAANAAAGVNG